MGATKQAIREDPGALFLGTRRRTGSQLLVAHLEVRIDYRVSITVYDSQSPCSKLLQLLKVRFARNMNADPIEAWGFAFTELTADPFEDLAALTNITVLLNHMVVQ
jgi:hypothetical protein